MDNLRCFNSNGEFINHFTQWDVNQTITVKDLEFEGTPIFHFSNKNCNRALGVKSTINEDGSITANVPNSLLQEPLMLNVYLYTKNNEIGTTIYHSRISVREKSQPLDYEYTDNVDVIYIEEAVEEIKALETKLQNTVDDVIAKLENGEFNGKDGVNGTDGKDGLNGTDGQNGQDGIGISSANINVDGELVFTFSDNQTINLGKIVGKDGPQGEKGDKGEPGKGTETIVVTTNEELTAALEKITSEFKAGSVYSVIGTGSLLGIESPFSDTDLKSLPAERIIIDRGTGEYKDALVVTNYVNTTMLHLNQERRITTLKSNVASINSRIAMPKRYADLENTAYDAKTGARFDASSNNTHVIATLILPSSESAVTLNIGTALLTLPSVKENSSLTFEAEKITNEIWKAEYTLVDDTGNLVVSDTVYKKSGISKASRIALTGYAAEKTFTITYLAGGQI